MADGAEGMPQDLIAVVERSPQAAAAHDRAGWVGLFTADGRVEDPVGSRPHVGHQQIGCFYDTFIGPRDITFHRDLDIARDSVVVRDLELEVAMGPAVVMHIPAILRYDLRRDGDDWKLTRLRAYWELPAMVWQFARHGRHAVPAAAQLTRALLGNQGASGTAGFATGFRRAGSRQKNMVDVFVGALARGDTSAAARMLSPGAAITLGDHGATDIAALGAELAGARSARLLGAGDTVAVSLVSGHQRGVLFARVRKRPATITKIRYFPQLQG
ncbi:MAG TPA: ketosteroid isomerase family protein [Mycobacterium sp.]|nr:ketosteroid isomerase family protein [Mycobacterium sp.]